MKKRPANLSRMKASDLSYDEKIKIVTEQFRNEPWKNRICDLKQKHWKLSDDYSPNQFIILTPNERLEMVDLYFENCPYAAMLIKYDQKSKAQDLFKFIKDDFFFDYQYWRWEDRQEIYTLTIKFKNSQDAKNFAIQAKIKHIYLENSFHFNQGHQND
jgi:hypothetical protein